MKRLNFRELLLVSHREKRARKIVFHPKITVIRGKNDTGKSSIIKSIFTTFGAVPANIHPYWKRANIISLLRFSVDSSEYSLYRYGQSFSLFTGADRLVETFDSVTDQLGPKLANLFDFKLTLMTHEGESKTPTPAYFFLPYYVDQDIGWTRNWSSFENLGQFKNWRKDLIYYHTGIHPNRWYELKNIIRNLTMEREEPVQRERVLKDILKSLQNKLSTAHFDIDVQAYKNEIDRLLKQCELLRVNEEEYKKKLVELETERIRLEAQQEIVSLARHELFDDYEFADDILEDQVNCPICGASYSNSFAERFSIACDEDRCVTFLQQIRHDLDSVKEKIKKHIEVLNDTSLELAEVNSLLASKQGEVTLKDLIENEGRREISSTLNTNIAEIQEYLVKIDTEIRKVEEELGNIADKDRTKEILNNYRNRMRTFLRTLNVITLDDSGFKNIGCSIKETGSDQPRAILAYIFSILHVISKFGSSAFCPIVIDAPKQQEQDSYNYLKMLEFIRDNLPTDSQLILSLVDDCGIDFGGSVIDMTMKNYALLDYEYSIAAKEIAPYSDANLGV